MERFKNKTVLITGASSGIGEALSRAFAREGADLILTARRADRLRALAQEIESQGGKAVALACDVTHDGDLEKAVSAGLERFGKIDVVVANAGFSVVGKFQKLKLEDYRRQFETNVFGVLRTYHAAAEALEKSKGTFVLMGSVSGHLSAPEVTPYSMSKFAVRAMAEATRMELKPLGISVVLISPGFVESEIRKIDNQGIYRPERKDGIAPWLRMPAEKAACKMLSAIHRKKREAVITLHGKVVVFLSRHFSGMVYWLLNRFFSKGLIKRN